MVTVGPVFWGSYPGEMLESVMAVLVAQDHPDVLRRTPSSGDGGVDLLIQETGGWHVRQVKGFVGRMKPSWRRQIERSLSDLLEEPRLSEPVTLWSLTVPIDPTSAEQLWFEELTADAPFRCVWNGKVFWDSLAANHPHVIDYCLRDGRGRVEAKSRDLLGAVRAERSPSLTAAEAAAHVAGVRSALNRQDPHYRYDFRIHAGPEPTPDEWPTGTVMASSSGLDDGTVLTLLVVAKHRYAIEDAPIGGDVTVTIFDPVRGIDLRNEFDQFRMFGTALEVPDGALAGTTSAPGGLGGDFEGAGGRIGPVRVNGAPERSRLCVIDPEGSATELRLSHQSITRGELGGGEVLASDDNGVLKLAMRFGPLPDDGGPPSITVRFGLQDFRGRPVLEVLPVSRLLVGFTVPNDLQWMDEYGSGTIAAGSIAEDSCSLPASIARFIDNLATIQGHVRGTVYVPEDWGHEVVTEVAGLARLFKTGEVRGTWTGLALTLRDGVDLRTPLSSVSEGPLVHEAGWFWEIEGRHYELGRIRHEFAQARPALEQPSDGRTLRFVPGADNTYIERLGSVQRHEVA